MTADAVGGVWDYAVMLCSQLATAHDVEICLVSMGPPPTAAQVEATRHIPGLTLIPTSYALEWMPDSLPRSSRPASSCAGWWPSTAPGSSTSTSTVSAAWTCLSLPWSSPIATRSSWQHAQWGTVEMNSGWQGYRTLVEQGLRGATAVVAPTGYVADSLQASTCPICRCASSITALRWSRASCPRPMRHGPHRRHGGRAASGTAQRTCSFLGQAAALLPAPPIRSRSPEALRRRTAAASRLSICSGVLLPRPNIPP